MNNGRHTVYISQKELQNNLKLTGNKKIYEFFYIPLKPFETASSFTYMKLNLYIKNYFVLFVNTITPKV